MPRIVSFGYAVAGLLLVPAAVAISLFPVNWLLGTTDFQPLPLNWSPAAYIAGVPIAVMAYIIGSQRIWPLAPALIAGMVLLFIPLNTNPIGTDPGRIEQARANIGKLPDWLTERLFVLSDPGRVAELQLLVDQAKSAYDEEWGQRQPVHDEWIAAHARKTKIESSPCVSFNNLSNAFCRLNKQQELDKLAPRVTKADAAYSASNEHLQTLEKQLADARAALESEQRLVASNKATADRTNAERLSKATNAPYLAAASLAFLVLMYAAGFRNLFFAVLLIGTLAVCLWSVGHRPAAWSWTWFSSSIR